MDNWNPPPCPVRCNIISYEVGSYSPSGDSGRAHATGLGLYGGTRTSLDLQSGPLAPDVHNMTKAMDKRHLGLLVAAAKHVLGLCMYLPYLTLTCDCLSFRSQTLINLLLTKLRSVGRI